MPDYRDAINKVLLHEGGYVNHPADKGGPTNFGVTQKTYTTYLKRPATILDVQTMKIETAKDIYKKMYWDMIKGDSIKQYAIAAMIFDQAINRGHVSAIQQAQKVLGLPQDGIMGPVTLAALNGVTDSAFIPKYIAASIAFYNALATKDPTQIVFLAGWLKRAESLRQYAMSFLGSVNATTVGVSIVALTIVGVGGFFLYQYLTTPKVA